MADGPQIEFPVFLNKTKSGKQPDFRGRIEMSKALAKEIVDAIKTGETPYLQVAFWQNEAKATGESYLYGRMSMDLWYMNKEREKREVEQQSQDMGQFMDKDDGGDDDLFG
jgi:hypothetical protein